LEAGRRGDAYLGRGWRGEALYIPHADPILADLLHLDAFDIGRYITIEVQSVPNRSVKGYMFISRLGTQG
jgi:hypothetical protein